ncbi:polysaccharide pyruvyl transferase family protein [Sporofaciens sp. SGI.106]|uniref:polysaccharide pyruvyl transferase family protein n=1 Tax=Sporofaciens sp. SGI.106 TaxID=3420568 RepID=UPI003D07C244
MKKAGIITHYNVHNHGAHLQLYGLSCVLRNLGYEAKALQFQKNYDFMGGASTGDKYNISLKSIPVYAKYLIKNGASRTVYNYKKRKGLAAFRKKTDIVGAYYSEAKDLDVVVIGSDEIFSIEAGPNPWYYGIGVPCKKQISYAASFGPTTMEMIEEHNMSSMISAGLASLKEIAVRDKNSSEIVKKLTSREAKIVCDPVLLYDWKTEKNLDMKKRPINEKYCIVYSYDYNMNDTDTVNAIKKYAAKRNLKVVSLAYFHKWCDENVNVDPLDIFAWFANSEMVFTDTFHGSVLSLVTGAQFVAKIRGNGNKLSFLLDQYGVLERKVDDFSGIEEISHLPINYEEVNKTIVSIRKESLDYLEKALG